MAIMFTRRSFLQLVGASTAAITGSEFLAQVAAKAAPGLSPNGLVLQPDFVTWRCRGAGRGTATA